MMYNSINNFEYRGVKFQIVKEGNIILYKTTFPVIYQGQKAEYSIYLRNDPRELEKKVPIIGEFNIKKIMVINATEDFNCDGFGVIAMANFAKQSLFGIEIIKDPEATCDMNNTLYTYINLQSGNETNIEQVGPSCYNININNCEILEATERFMTESFVEINKLL